MVPMLTGAIDCGLQPKRGERSARQKCQNDNSMIDPTTKALIELASAIGDLGDCIRMSMSNQQLEAIDRLSYVEVSLREARKAIDEISKNKNPAG